VITPVLVMLLAVRFSPVPKVRADSFALNVLQSVDDRAPRARAEADGICSVCTLPVEVKAMSVPVVEVANV